MFLVFIAKALGKHGQLAKLLGIYLSIKWTSQRTLNKLLEYLIKDCIYSVSWNDQNLQVKSLGRILWCTRAIVN